MKECVFFSCGLGAGIFHSGRFPGMQFVSMLLLLTIFVCFYECGCGRLELRE